MKGLNPTWEYIALFAAGVCSIELSTREARANRLLGRARDDHVTRLPLLVDHDDDDTMVNIFFFFFLLEMTLFYLERISLL